MARRKAQFPAKMCQNLSRDQRTLVRQVAKATGASQASVVRAALDEGVDVMGAILELERIPAEVAAAERAAAEELRRLEREVAALERGEAPPPGRAPARAAGGGRKKGKKKTERAGQLLIL